MTILRAWKAVMATVLMLFGPMAQMVEAQNLEVVREGMSRSLNVVMNQAVVVESDVPFAELSIANPAIADLSTLSDRTIYVLGKSPGRTTLTILDASGRLITNVDVRVSADTVEFKERLRQILPNEKIEVRTANDGIVLSGTVSSTTKLDRALELAQRYAPDRVSNLLSVSGKQQVMLKVRFAEMQRTVAKQLSTSLGVFDQGSDFGVSGETGTFLDGDNSIFSPNIVTQPDIEGAISFGFGIGSTQVGILLEALESKGIVRSLSEPNLTALSGQEATFLAGGEFPIPVAQEDGLITIEFKPFGVELNFVPRVVEDGVINLELAAAVSSLDSANAIEANGLSINAFRRRDTSTTVALRDGQSFAIAGLLEDDFIDNNGQVPWLGDVPVLGTLFRSADFQRSQTELVIIVSAHLVSPTTGEALALPTDRVRIPSERELFLNGRVAIDVSEDDGPEGQVARQDFTGSYGYIME